MLIDKFFKLEYKSCFIEKLKAIKSYKRLLHFLFSYINFLISSL